MLLSIVCMHCVRTLSTTAVESVLSFCTDYKDVVLPECNVEKNDRHYLQSAMKKAVKNKQIDPCMLIKTLYVNTYIPVADILESNDQHSRKIVRAVRTDIELELAEGDAKALTTTLTMEKLLDTLCISRKWDDTHLLERMVCFLPEGARTLAMSLLERYKLYLDAYNDAVKVKDSLTKAADVPEVTKAQIPVEVTVAKDLSEFSRKDCKEMFDLLLHKAWKIPLTKCTVVEARSGDSTTVVFIIDKAFSQSIIKYSVERSALWAFNELGVTRVRISGLVEVNVSQLLTQHFKESLCSGLTGDMDFLGATKVCGRCEVLVPLFASLHVIFSSTTLNCNVLTKLFILLL